MAYRNLMITKPAKIFVRQEQLIISGEAEERKAPIEDLLSVLIENQQCTITAAALSKLADQGVVVFICNDKHLPCSIFTPTNQHSRRLSVLQNQLQLTKPAQKQLWQQIIRQKIKNQSLCLELTGHDGSKIAALVKEVRSGDSTNAESTAAMLYFVELFGKHFVRRDEQLLNSALNYGYSILRGIIAKYLAVYGFEPSLGLHHHNALNNFNLADDLIEPFRPLVDLYAALNFNHLPQDTPLNTTHKSALYNLINHTILSNGEEHAVHYAIERMVKSLSNCVNNGFGQLILPELTPLRLHQYE